MHFSCEPSPGPQVPPRSPRRRSKPKQWRQPVQPSPRPWGVPPAKRREKSQKPKPFLTKWLELENRPAPAPPKPKPKPRPKPKLLLPASADKATQQNVECVDAFTLVHRHDDDDASKIAKLRVANAQLKSDEERAQSELTEARDKLATARLAAEEQEQEREQEQAQGQGTKI